MKSLNTFSWNAFVRVYAVELVQASYKGVLVREADSVGLSAYSKTLKRVNNLTEFLKELSFSDEHWKQSVSHRANELVITFYQALLGCEPDSEALEIYAAKLAETQDLKQLLVDISNSDEHKLRYTEFSNYAVDLIDSVFRGLLSRTVDESAATAYTKLLHESDDLAKVISIVLDSDEFVSRFKKKHLKKTQSVQHYWSDRVNHIDFLYRRYCKRTVYNKELSKHIENDEPVWKIHRSLLATRLKKDKLRVLIFGAFGNGNIGDIYQALAMRAHLKSAWKLEDTDIFACSLLNSSDYPFPEDQKLPSRAIYDIELVNSFDCLIIGGGGLLAHPHDPLPNHEWVSEIHTPILLVGIGASLEHIPLHKVLLEKAIYVSGRDNVSNAAISTVRSDVVNVPDPILTISTIDLLTEFDLSKTISKKIDILWILKYPSNDHDKMILASIKTLIKDSEKVHIIVAIEPKLDRVLDGYFVDNEVIYIDTLSDLVSYIANTDVVFSMRYHGAIFSLLMGCRTFGSSQSKIRELFNDLGGRDAYFERPEEIVKVIQDSGIYATKDQLANMQLQFQDNLKAFNLANWSNSSSQP